MFLLFTAFFCLASAFSANKVILFSLSPELLVGLRMTLSSLALAAITTFRGLPLFRWHTIKYTFGWLCVIALFTTFFPANLKAYALANMPSSKMAFFGTLDPFIAALYSYFLFEEKLTRRQWTGIVIGFLGMVILLLGSSPLEEQLHAFGILSWPEIAALLAVIISRWGWIQGQQLLKREHLTPTQFTIGTMALGGFFSLMLAFLRGTTNIISLNRAEFPFLQKVPLSLLSASQQLGLFLAYTIVIGNMIGYTLYAHVLKRYSVTFIALAGFSIPLLVQALGTLFLGEPLSLIFFLAFCVTFCGVLLFSLDEIASRRSPNDK